MKAKKVRGAAPATSRDARVSTAVSGARGLVLGVLVGAAFIPDIASAQMANETRGTPPNQEYYYCQPFDPGGGGWTYRADLWGGSWCQWQPDTAANNPPPPAAPSASNGSFTATFETPKTFTLSASGSITSYQVVGAPSHGSTSLAGSTLTYTPASGYYGSDLFTWQAVGPGGSSNTATVNVTVSAPAAPTAADGSLDVNYDAAKSGSLSGSGAVSGYSVSQPSHGVVALVGSGPGFSYTPSAGYIGADSFTYTVSGPGGTSPAATVSITVHAPAAPVAGDASLSVAYDTAHSASLPASGVIDSFSVAQPAHGVVALVNGGPGYEYTPLPGYYGADSFTYSATGPGGASGTGSITISVAVPATPTATGAALNVAFETAGVVQLAGAGVFGSYAISTPPSHGTVALVGGQATYTPSANYIGADSFAFTVTGPGGTSAPAAIVVDVASPGIPTIQGATLSTAYGAAIASAVTVAGEWDVVLVSSPPSHGTVTIQGVTVTYTPNAGYAGPDSFDIVAQGPGGTSNAAVVAVSVAAAPVAPPPPPAPLKAGDWSGTTPANTGIEINLESVVSGAQPSAFAVVKAPRHGAVDVQRARAVYRPAADFRGSDSFVYRAMAASGVSAEGTVTISVVGGLVAIDHSVNGIAGKPVTVDLTAGATGGPFTAAGVVSNTDSAAGTADVVKSGGKFLLTFTPAGQFAGELTIGYVLSTGNATSAPARVKVSIAARPNLSTDHEVGGIVNSQAQAAVRFAGSQTANVMRRMETLHRGESGGASFNISLPFANKEGPGFDPARDRARDGWGGRNDSQSRAADSQRVAARGHGEPGPVGIWAGGAIDYGRRKAADGSAKSTFATSGVSAGIDAQLSRDLVVGGGVGYGDDVSDIGAGGTKSEGSSTSAFAYGSFHPTPTTYIDAMVGVGQLNFQSRRFVPANGAMVTGARSGDQVFGAVAFGLEYDRGPLFASPYGRLEFMDATLGAFKEAGDDTYTLEYAKQRLVATTAVLGGRVAYRFDMERGRFIPTLRMEYRHGLQHLGTATVSYADWAASPLYQIDLGGYASRNLVVGAGAEWKGISGWSGWVEWETDVLRQGGETSRIKAGGGYRF